MSMNLLYSYKEGLIGLKRARFATAMAISTVAITLTLFSIFLTFTLNINRMVGEVRGKLALEVFIDRGLSEHKVDRIRNNLSQINGVETVDFISSEQALEQFTRDLGMDPVEILGENPLPPSFKLSLSKSKSTISDTEKIRDQIEAVDGVDEVLYHGRLIAAIDRYGRIILFVDIGLFIIVLLATIMLVANTLRLTILSQKRTIDIMALVGATRRFIRRPYVIQGILQGVAGGLVASLLIWILTTVISLRFPNLIHTPIFLYAVPVILGFILGYTGSCVGLNKFMR